MLPVFPGATTGEIVPGTTPHTQFDADPGLAILQASVPGVVHLAAEIRGAPHFPVARLVDAGNWTGTVDVLTVPTTILPGHGLTAFCFIRFQPDIGADRVVLCVLHDELGGRAKEANPTLYGGLENTADAMVGQDGADFFSIRVRPEPVTAAIPKIPAQGRTWNG